MESVFSAPFVAAAATSSWKELFQQTSKEKSNENHSLPLNQLDDSKSLRIQVCPILHEVISPNQKDVIIRQPQIGVCVCVCHMFEEHYYTSWYKPVQNDIKMTCEICAFFFHVRLWVHHLRPLNVHGQQSSLQPMSWWFSLSNWVMTKKLGCLWYTGDETSQFYRDYNKLV